MRKALVKIAFWIVTLIVTIILLIAGQFVLDAILPSGDRILFGVIVMVVCLSAAGNITSILFRAARFTDEHLSVFGARRLHRPD